MCSIKGKGTHKGTLRYTCLSRPGKNKTTRGPNNAIALRLIFTLIQFGMFHECLVNNFRALNVNENQREIFLTLLIKFETHVERAPQNTYENNGTMS